MTVAKESGNRLLIDDALAKSGKRTVSAYEVSHVMTLLGWWKPDWASPPCRDWPCR